MTSGATADAALVEDAHERHGAALFDFVRHLGLSDEEAYDAVQEVFLRLWREYRRGTAIDNPAGWTYRTAYRVAMGEHRWRRRMARVLPRLSPHHPAFSAPEEGDRVAVWSTVDRLPERQRQALYLHYAADLDFEVIGRVLGISASTARTHASRGLASLRDQLGGWEQA